MSTPFKRDPMKELAAACKRRRHQDSCFYHSIMDWHHPRLPGLAALGTTWPKGDRFRSLRAATSKGQVQGTGDQLRPARHPLVRRRMGRHLDARARQGSLRLPAAVCSPASSSTTASASRACGHQHGADQSATTARPSRTSPPPALPGVDWETCMTMNDTWGYNQHDQNWKSDRDADPQLDRHRQQGRQLPAQRRPDRRRPDPRTRASSASKQSASG